jgi:glycosyltransferase involved in cell wall biosynthesis
MSITRADYRNTPLRGKRQAGTGNKTLPPGAGNAHHFTRAATAAMSARRRIAFLQQGSFSHINASVEAQLRRVFPDHELETVDLTAEFLRRRSLAVLNRLQVWRHYARDLVSGRRTYWDCFYRTPWLFHRIRRWVAGRLAPVRGELDFTFQTQSLFDASLADTPHFLYTDHTHLANLGYPDFEPRMLFPETWVALERQIYLGAARNFTMSRHVERSLVEDYGCPPERVQCVFAGCNAPVAEVEPGLARFARKRILFNGVDWSRKGGPELAAAFKLVLARHPDARLIVLGCEPALRLPNCEVVGRVPLDAVPGHYAEASIFCLPTRREPFGIVFVEAMQHGLPIVSTRIGALPDMVEDGRNGWLVPPGAVKPLADALCKLLDSPETCAAYGAAGRALAAERYNWEAVGNRLGEAIRQGLADRSTK